MDDVERIRQDLPDAATVDDRAAELLRPGTTTDARLLV
jgi:hypothetical protein